MKKTAVIGAGLSGLACALELEKHNHQVTIFEASDKVGGRVKTDNIDGFLLDHGFQVFLPSYEMGAYFLDYKKLKLQAFDPGAYILKENQLHLLSDPLRAPKTLFSTLFSPLATIKDKALTAKLIFQKDIKYKEISTSLSTQDYLKSFGFSEQYINDFFIPFFSGVFLNKDLSVPADFFRFLFQSFSKAYACLPKNGMRQIPEQMAQRIGEKNIILNKKTTADQLLADGYEHVFVSHIPESEKFSNLEFHSVKTSYYKTKSSKWATKTLYLNSAKNSVVNHVACLTAVNPHYAPNGWHLFSVNSLSFDSSDQEQDLINFFGKDEIKNWEHIKTYDVKKALPANPYYGSFVESGNRDISYCGDYLESPSIQGALYSGLKAARSYLNLSI